MAYMTRHRAKVARDNLALEFQHIEGCHVWRVSAAATAAGRMHVGRLHETREQQRKFVTAICMALGSDLML